MRGVTIGARMRAHVLAEKALYMTNADFFDHPQGPMLVGEVIELNHAPSDKSFAEARITDVDRVSAPGGVLIALGNITFVKK